jgi:hypothetical protein
MRRGAWLFALPWVAACAATVQVDLSEGGKAHLNLPVAVDDAHLAEPPGYFAPDAASPRVVRRITVENTGSAPVRNPDIRVNGRPLLPVKDSVAQLGLEGIRGLPELFAAWRDRVIHATSDLEAGRDPAMLLTAFGAAYCGDDARALAAITVTRGGEARFARLNGHSVAEHRLGDSPWMLLDGDQNLLYLGWDNRTPVGEEEILADPLLALRTQVFGRQSRWQADAAWQNTSRFEFVEEARAPKVFRLKRTPPSRDWTLLPGEKVVIDLDRVPERALAASDALRANAALRAATCVVDFVPRRADGETLSLPYPVLTGKNGEPVYEAKAGKAAILCQAARAQFPLPQAGDNVIESKSGGKLRLTLDYEGGDFRPTPAPGIDPVTLRIRDHEAKPDRVWWQISGEKNFSLVAPNLDRTAEFSPTFQLTPVDETFLSAGPHYVRAKVRRAGVWSDWSEPVAFAVAKPPTPRIVSMEGADGDRMCVRWTPCAGEMLVFGSNRLDFLPEVFGDTEIVRMEAGAVRESRPNRNLLATVPGSAGEAYVPLRACYRLIVRKDGVLSVPSKLGRSKMPAQVLQNRHEKAEGALTGRDIAAEKPVRASLVR